MKILLCLNKDIYCKYILNLLLEGLSSHQIKIYFSDKVGSKPIDNPELINLQKIEKDLSKENFGFLLKERANYKGSKQFINFEEIANSCQLEILNFKNINQDGLEYLKQNWTPDLIISIRFGQIFKNPIIKLPKFGIINLHSGILPDYRGIMATFWAMRERQKQIGCTLHFIDDASIDTGKIIEIARINADYKKSLMVNIFAVYDAGLKIIIHNINLINDAKALAGFDQDDNLGRYFSYPTSAQIKESGITLF